MPCGSIKYHFQPHPLLRGGHLQTFGGQLGAPPLDPNAHSQHFWTEVSDGDQLIHYVDEPVDALPSCPTVLTLHGLGGSSDSSYNLRLRDKLVQKGVRVVRFNHRGCGVDRSVRPTHGIYHAGRTDDVLATLRAVATRWSSAPFVALGFSLSGNILLRLLGTQQMAIRSIPNLISAASICSPVDLEACSQSLIKHRNKLIDRYYVKNMLALVTHRANLLNEALPEAYYSKNITLRDFDAFYTAPRAGFQSRDEYYRLSSSQSVLKEIQLPTLVLAAADDPVVPVQSLLDAHFSRHCTMHIERTGGHMGFIQKSRTPWGDRRWMDAFLVDWCLQRLKGSRA